MTTLHAFTFNAFGEQTYLLNHGDGAATVFDPGMSTPLEQEEFAKFCEELGVKPVQCLLTHAHLDHIMGAAWVFNRWGLKPRLHPLDTATYEQAPRAAAVYGVPMENPPALGPPLASGERIRCGSSELEVRLTPATRRVMLFSWSISRVGSWGEMFCSSGVWGGPICLVAIPRI